MSWKRIICWIRGHHWELLLRDEKHSHLACFTCGRIGGDDMNWIRKILLKRLLKMGVFSLPQKGILYIEDLSQKELDDFAKDIQTFFEGEKPEPLLILVNKKVEVYSLKEIMKKEPILHAVDKEGWYLCNKACGITTKKVAKLQGKPVTCKNCLNILKKEVKK